LRHLAALLLSLTIFLLVFLVGALMTPTLAARWRAVEARAEADAVYQKRLAELRAEADAADERLKLLDQRVGLVSLGFREVVRKVGPSVVNLTSYADQRDGDFKDSKDWPATTDPDNGKTAYLAGSGSGVIIETEWILTNFHVVAPASKLRVTFASGYTISVSADRIRIDPLTDLAAVHLPASAPGVTREDDEFKVEFTDSDAVERGDLVLALGSPLGLKHSVTHGIISAKGRLLSALEAVEVLQTDAAINKGNSGGPLFDHRGRLVGINFAIASDNGYSQGIGFAIPSNTAKDVFEQLKQHGEVIRGDLGVKDFVEVPREQAQKWTRGGAVKIAYVESGQAADKAGLRRGDLIVRFNGELLSPVHTTRHLRQLIMESKVGQQAQVEIVRRDEKQTVAVTVGKRPPEPKKIR
jgi:serine protease Do